MKRKSSVLFILLAAVLIISFTVFGCTSTTPEDEPIELKVSLWSGQAHYNYKNQWLPWSELIEEETDGRVTATIYAGGALGGAMEQFDILEAGGADIASFNTGFTPGRFPLHSIIELPFMSPNHDVGNEILKRLYEKYPEFQAECDPVKVLYSGVNVAVVLNTVSVPVRSIEDMQGLTIRVNSPAGGDIITALGGTPVVMGMMDLYTAMERGTIDGAIYTLEAVQSFGLGPVTNYTTQIPLSTVQSNTGINQSTFDALPDDVQELITTGDLGWDWLAERSVEGMQIGLAEGIDILEARGGAWEEIILTPTEEARWRETLAPLYDQWAEARNAEGLPGTEMINDALQWAEELS